MIVSETYAPSAKLASTQWSAYLRHTSMAISNPVYTIQIQPVVKPVEQPAASCKQTFNRLFNRFDNR